MKTIRRSILCLAVLIFAAPILRAQDFSKYRGISLGTKLPTVLKQTEQRPVDVKSLHQQPALIQELTWWPPMLPGAAHEADSVRQILFRFQNGELYKMSVTYDRSAVEGLTEQDMLKSLSAKYGAPAMPTSEPLAAASQQQNSSPKIIALWENPETSIQLVRSAFPNGFGLIILSKRINAEAELAVVEAVKLEEQQGPQKEADRQKKVVDDLEAARQKNLKNFQP